MKIVTLIFLGILLYIVKFLWTNDIVDRRHPFGGDNDKLKTYLARHGISRDRIGKFPKGEDYGVQTYWGKPNKKDSICRSLDKIEWLATNYKTEVIWRRCLVYAIVLGLLIFIAIGKERFEIDRILSVILLLYIGFYMSKSYENTHIMNIKSKFLEKNVGAIKEKLNLDQKNSIFRHPIL